MLWIVGRCACQHSDCGSLGLRTPVCRIAQSILVQSSIPAVSAALMSAGDTLSVLDTLQPRVHNRHPAFEEAEYCYSSSFIPERAGSAVQWSGRSRCSARFQAWVSTLTESTLDSVNSAFNARFSSNSETNHGTWLPPLKFSTKRCTTNMEKPYDRVP